MPPNAMADCVFPDDIMVSILTRLPVKSIIRFKSVCKPLHELLSSRDFIKMHLAQFSNAHKNQSFIVYRTNQSCSNTMSLFNIESDEMKPTTFYHPFSNIFLKIEIVGCYNGLFCIREGQMFFLWNPVLDLAKTVRPPYVIGLKAVSFGFGYDAVGADFKVVRILFVCMGGEKVSDGVEAYSVNSDSWTTIKLDFQFTVFRTKSDVIVNGNPYWYAQVYENEGGKRGMDDVLLCFDVTELVFKVVPRSTFSYEDGAELEVLVDWYGSLGALVCTMDDEVVESLDVWLFDEGEQIWRKNQTFGRIDVNVHTFLLCLKNGKILGKLPDGKLFVFHSEGEAGCVEFLSYGPQENQSVEIYGYSETLACIEGMKRMKFRKRMRKMIDYLRNV